MATRPDTPASARTDWWGRATALAQIAATVVAVVLAAILIGDQKRSDAIDAGHAAARAYAVQFEVIDRGVKDMVKCGEMLPPYAVGGGTRVAFQDLKALGAVLSTQQLATVEEASDQLDRLFPATYHPPLAGTEAAYLAWKHNHVLQTRTLRARWLLRGALAALGGREPRTNKCFGRERKARSKPV
jgi:hypothetical protein